MSKHNRILRNKEREDVIEESRLALYKIDNSSRLLESNYKAIMAFYIKEAMLKVRNKKKFSKRYLIEVSRIASNFIKRLDPYASLSIMLRSGKKTDLQCNLDRIYTSRLGRLYDLDKWNVNGKPLNIFVTSHCLDRYKERVKEESHSAMRRSQRNVMYINDMVSNITISLNLGKHYYEGMAVTKTNVYIPCADGIIACRNTLDKGVIIGKSWLKPDMVDLTRNNWLKI